MSLILIICTANICRSPVAAGLLRQKLERQGFSDRQVLSAGTLGVEGWPPAEESAALMAIRGVDITEERSSAVSPELLTRSNLVLCMEDAHVDTLRRMCPQAEGNIHRLATLAGEPRDIADPYGGSLKEFETMVADVDDLLERGLDRILELSARS